MKKLTIVFLVTLVSICLAEPELRTTLSTQFNPALGGGVSISPDGPGKVVLHVGKANVSTSKFGTAIQEWTEMGIMPQQKGLVFLEQSLANEMGESFDFDRDPVSSYAPYSEAVQKGPPELLYGPPKLVGEVTYKLYDIADSPFRIVIVNYSDTLISKARLLKMEGNRVRGVYPLYPETGLE